MHLYKKRNNDLNKYKERQELTELFTFFIFFNLNMYLKTRWKKKKIFKTVPEKITIQYDTIKITLVIRII